MNRGVSIVYISHHLEEALQITNHAVVLRDGAMTAYAERKDIDLEWIVRHMVGDNFALGSPPTGYDKGDVALSIEGLTVPDTVALSYELRGAGMDVPLAALTPEDCAAGIAKALHK